MGEDSDIPRKLDAVARLVAQRDETRARLARVEADVYTSCAAAHTAAASWDQVAALVGISRQALQKRLAERKRDR